MKIFFKYRFLLFLSSLWFISCQKEENKEYLFQLLPSEKTGIHFNNKLKNTPELNILTYLYYYNGAGIAAADFNNDGLEDLYFIANQGKNKLFINQGAFIFKESTPRILEDTQGWSTGVTVVDINNDGWQDIYLCKLGNYKELKDKNKLFVHQGLDSNGTPIFKEEASKYKLDFSGFSTQASFFDYDLDGDLDMYLMNHSVHPNRTYGRGTKRKQIDSVSGDRLYQNDNEKYVDVSKKAGIFQGAIGYGLGLATSDVNNDGYPDIYIGNDFFENDYLYINQKDGTFKEMNTDTNKSIQHTSHFSMGVDIADINNDGHTDIVSLDMLPEDLETYKTSGTEYGFTIYNQYLKNGYQPQYMQNALQLNRGNDQFSEVAFYAGIAATEWSWASLIADYDNDGLKDIFITNGIKGATNDMDFISFIANKNIQKRINKGMTTQDLALIDELPDKKVTNYFFKNSGDVKFKNMSGIWAENIPSYSNGAVYSDLDMDGDLDLVVNNVDGQAFVYKNQSQEKYPTHHFIKFKLIGNAKNKNAIGAKVKIHYNKNFQIAEIFPTKGYVSATASPVHFGLGKNTKIDSVTARWPDGLENVYKNLKVDTLHILKRNNKKQKKNINSVAETSYLKKKLVGIPYKHQDYETKDFSTEPLAPFSISNEGPHIAIIDINTDSLQDIYVPGGRFKAGSFWIQKPDGNFYKSKHQAFEDFKIYEDIDQTFFDVDNDGDFDMISVYGGNERFSEYESGSKLFLNMDGNFTFIKDAFPTTIMNAAVITHADIDGDGDEDVFIGCNTISGSYGATPKSYLFINNGQGKFEDVTTSKIGEFTNMGQIFDATFIDINKDSFKDLIVVGHYIPITILLNDGKGNFKKNQNISLQHSHGWWNCIEIKDMDMDGDLDIIAGNWGLNSRLKASKKEPIRLFLNDFDHNGKVDPIVTYYYQGKETPMATKDELVKQLPILNKKFLSYTDFAKAAIKDYFSPSAWEQSEKKEVFTLATTYFENEGDLQFKPHILPIEAQLSTVHDILIDDINHDGYPDMILGGNTYEINTQLGRLDGSYGEILLNDKKGSFYSASNFMLDIKGAVRSIKSIKIKEEKHLIFGINNDSLQVFKNSLNK